MQPIQQILPNLYWVGGNDRRLSRFENMHPLPNGITYNSYLLADEKTALIDTVDVTVADQFTKNLEAALNGRTLDYLIILHMEPDHCADMEHLCQQYPNMKIVGNQKTLQFFNQFFSLDLGDRFITVKENDELSLGQQNLRFIMAPMVHWPEVMFCYESFNKVLYSADAFGSFGAFSGHLYADEVDFEEQYLAEARRYYTNIVGKYGPQVQAALKKVADLPIEMICALHGPIWRKNIEYYIDKYDHWSRYEPEEKGIVIAYGSMYGNTEHVANLLATRLAERGFPSIRMYDVSNTHASYIIADFFRYSHLVLAAPTYNMDLYLPMGGLLHDMSVLNIQNRKAAVIANGSWAPAAHNIMSAGLEKLKNVELVAEPMVIRSAFKPEQEPELEAIVEALCNSL